MEKYKFGWEPSEEALAWLGSKMITSREQLLERVRERREEARVIGRTDQKHSAAYYGTLDALFEKLISGIERLVLFDRLEPCWTYSFGVSSRGAFVWLQHVGYVSQNEEGQFLSVAYNAEYELLSISCRMLTVDEFARIYGVERITVLQWIRRGKIRSVRRIGKEWRISELTELPGRKYTPGSYTWTEELSDLPPEYDYLRKPASVLITQEEDPTRFTLSIRQEDADPPIRQMPGIPVKEREKLELTLLSHPLVVSSSVNETTW